MTNHIETSKTYKRFIYVFYIKLLFKGGNPNAIWCIIIINNGIETMDTK